MEPGSDRGRDGRSSGVLATLSTVCVEDTIPDQSTFREGSFQLTVQKEANRYRRESQAAGPCASCMRRQNMDAGSHLDFSYGFFWDPSP